MGRAIKGEANDHELGKINDLGMKIGGLAIAGYLMTKKEKAKPDIINASRKRRIAAGAGVQVEDVNKLLKQFEQMRKMFKGFNKKGKHRKLPKGLMGGGFPGNFGF